MGSRRRRDNGQDCRCVQREDEYPCGAEIQREGASCHSRSEPFRRVEGYAEGRGVADDQDGFRAARPRGRRGENVCVDHRSDGASAHGSFQKTSFRGSESPRGTVDEGFLQALSWFARACRFRKEYEAAKQKSAFRADSDGGFRRGYHRAFASVVYRERGGRREGDYRRAAFRASGRA
ncbi:MAG: hypothetical protein BWX67_02306 [Thermotogae bacterium ADurb.Bin062]|nr:MAG: hypothetical protein BWX67_02306 [Thermotogota bacterium ADurb.Bin062]